eukprot:scaffold1911_cov397-Prasinococcus_capsulatus_cf.AAC.16
MPQANNVQQRTGTRHAQVLRPTAPGMAKSASRARQWYGPRTRLHRTQQADQRWPRFGLHADDDNQWNESVLEERLQRTAPQVTESSIVTRPSRRRSWGSAERRRRDSGACELHTLACLRKVEGHSFTFCLTVSSIAHLVSSGKILRWIRRGTVARAAVGAPSPSNTCAGVGCARPPAGRASTAPHRPRGGLPSLHSRGRAPRVPRRRPPGADDVVDRHHRLPNHRDDLDDAARSRPPAAPRLARRARGGALTASPTLLRAVRELVRLGSRRERRMPRPHAPEPAASTAVMNVEAHVGAGSGLVAGLARARQITREIGPSWRGRSRGGRPPLATRTRPQHTCTGLWVRACRECPPVPFADNAAGSCTLVFSALAASRWTGAGWPCLVSGGRPALLARC